MIPVNWHPDRRQLRLFGLACVVVFGALGAWTFARGTLLGLAVGEAVRPTLAAALWTVAAACGVLALCAPSILRPLYVGLTALGLPIGYVVSRAVMAAVFFGVLTPIGLLFRAVGRDPLCRRWEPGRDSYWEPRPAMTDVRRYFRQF